MYNNQGDDQQQKIYSLVNVQEMGYDQAVKAQTTFERLLSNSTTQNEQPHKFTLVIFCSSEKEDKSVFATSFNRYRKNVPMEQDLEAKLRAYLAQHLKLSDSALKQIEKDGLRIMTLDQAGVGKSLYMKRSIEKVKSQVNANCGQCCVSIKKQTLPFETVFNSLK